MLNLTFYNLKINWSASKNVFIPGCTWAREMPSHTMIIFSHNFNFNGKYVNKSSTLNYSVCNKENKKIRHELTSLFLHYLKYIDGNCYLSVDVYCLSILIYMAVGLRFIPVCLSNQERRSNTKAGAQAGCLPEA